MQERQPMNSQYYQSLYVRRGKNGTFLGSAAHEAMHEDALDAQRELARKLDSATIVDDPREIPIQDSDMPLLTDTIVFELVVKYPNQNETRFNYEIPANKKMVARNVVKQTVSIWKQNPDKSFFKLAEDMLTTVNVPFRRLTSDRMTINLED